jgi:hypothetical protein
MRSLPEWLTTQKNAVYSNLQKDQTTGKFADLMVLPPDRMPTPAQRQAIADHIQYLTSLLSQTPRNGEGYEQHTLTLITKLLLVLPAQEATTTAAEVRAEAMAQTLDDVPSWAVDCAIRRWYRGECPTDESGRPYDYRWVPAPSALRRIAMLEVGLTKYDIWELERLLAAQPFVDCSAELAQGQAAMRGLWKNIGKPDITELTFEKAVLDGGGIIGKATGA